MSQFKKQEDAAVEVALAK
jgi:hypothetical protein